MNKAAAARFLLEMNAFALIRFMNRARMPVLMYHRFSEDEEVGKTSRRVFESHLEYLTKYYSIIPLSQAVDCIANGRELPKRSVVITVDDGYRDFYEVAFPVLKHYGLPAAIYLVTDFVGGEGWIWTDKARFLLTRSAAPQLEITIGAEAISEGLGDQRSRLNAAGRVNSVLKKLPDGEKELRLAELSEALGVALPGTPPAEFAPLSWDHAQDLARYNIEIGSHTRSHPILTNVDEGRLEYELTESKRAIQEKLQLERVHFCYPNGDVSMRERQAAEAAGYASAVTTEIKLCENGTDPFLIPRVDAEPELHRFVQATSGFDRFKVRT